MLSPWKATKSSGELPLDGKLAVQFQYRHYISWEVLMSGLGIGMKVGTGTWKFQLITPSGTIIFEQKVTITLDLVSLGMMGVQLFTWYFVSEKIETTIIGGSACTSENPSWKYTLGGTEYSEQGYMETGGGSDYSDFMAYVTDWYDSPIYKFTIPPGTKLHVVQDTWSLGAKKRSEWQCRFKFGSLNKVDSTFGPLGELEVINAHNEGTLMVLSRSWGGAQVDVPLIHLDASSNPSVVVVPDGRRIYGVLQEDGYWLYQSFDMGRSATKVLYKTDSPTGTKLVRVYGPEVTMPQLVGIRDIQVVLGVVGNEIQIRKVTPTGPEAPLVVGRANEGVSYSLSISEAGMILVVDSSGKVVYKSSDAGSGWKAA